MASFGTTSTERLRTCDPRLRTLFTEIVGVFDCSIICGFRDEAAQAEVFKNGLSKAKFGQSPHNVYPSLAVDVVPYPIDWDDRERLAYFSGFVMAKAEEMAIPLTWGNDWDGDLNLNDNRLKDYPHFEIKGWRDET